MKKVTCKLKIVSPLYLGGADPKTTVSTPNGQAIKSMMRFWFRAMLGGIIPDITIAELNSLEGGVFGDTSNSPLRITFSVKKQPEQVTFLGKGNPAERLYGIEYIGYPLKNRRAFMPGNHSEADAELSLTFCQSYKWLYEMVLSSLWMALHLGGFGARSRRGFGRMRCHAIENMPSLDGLPDFSLPPQFDGLNKFYEDNFKKIEKIFKEYAEKNQIEPGKKIQSNRIKTIFDKPSSLNLPPYSCLRAGCWQIAIISKDDWTTLSKTMDDMGKTYRHFRTLGGIEGDDEYARTKDYNDYVKYFLPSPEGEADGKWRHHLLRTAVGTGRWNPRNDVLGLPYRIQSKSRAEEISPGKWVDLSVQIGWIDNDYRNNKKKYFHRASPLLFGPLQLHNKYAVIALGLKSKFFPEDLGKEILIHSGRRWNRLQDHNLFDNNYEWRRFQNIEPVDDKDVSSVLDEFMKFLKLEEKTMLP
ncbi:MAG: type III-B CRISPR module RAMP protein Cmr1 [Deltaproteobacteria bacterium]|nr:type III-B CRISPR module RAMP protein Cmr1 [Deltaproteobacteria bacterium]